MSLASLPCRLTKLVALSPPWSQRAWHCTLHQLHCQPRGLGLWDDPLPSQEQPQLARNHHASLPTKGKRTLRTLGELLIGGYAASTAANSTAELYPDPYAVPLLPHLDPNQSQSEVSSTLSRSKAVLGVPSGDRLTVANGAAYPRFCHIVERFIDPRPPGLPRLACTRRGALDAGNSLRNVCEAIAHIAGQTFVCAVLGADSQSRDSDIYDTKKDVCEEEERCAVVEVGQSMGGRTVELVDLLKHVCTSVFV
ncbi:hypothetical protein BGW80DRAFT_1459933 [Lactifluus volemus]|nr:hypothetical protein BGW80DRAFT_1459933 [Lactifluus volemus]